MRAGAACLQPVLPLPELFHGDNLHHFAAWADKCRPTILIDKGLVQDIFIMLGWTSQFRCHAIFLVQYVLFRQALIMPVEKSLP